MSKRVKISISAITVAVIMSVIIIIAKTNEVETGKGADIAALQKHGEEQFYIASDIEINMPTEEGHVFVPTRFREKKDFFTCEKIDINVKDYDIMPENGKPQSPQKGGTAYKLAYTTNIEPSEPIVVMCDNSALCQMPITGKAVEQFTFETILYIKNNNNHDIYIIVDNEESAHLRI